MQIEDYFTAAHNNEQGLRAKQLFAAVVLTALDDAMADDTKYGNGCDQIANWARSKDGREVLSNAGIEPSERVVQSLVEIVKRGIRTTIAFGHRQVHHSKELELVDS